PLFPYTTLFRSEGDDLPEDALPVVVDHELDEAAVPVVGDRGLGGRRGDRGDPLPEGEDSLAVVDVVRRRAGVEDLVQSGVEPAVADVNPDDQPDDGHAGVRKEEFRERRVRDLAWSGGEW